MGKRPKQTILQGGHTEGPETYEKILSITIHQRDANKTTMIYTSYCLEWPSLTDQQTSAGEVVEKRGP